MPRQGRERSKSGIYHVMVRGINRQEIFNDDEDRHRYIETLQKAKDKSGCELYGYCLMDNHVHLLLKETSESISQIMQDTGTVLLSYFVAYAKLIGKRAGSFA